jgi:hypothetical protein
MSVHNTIWSRVISIEIAPITEVTAFPRNNGINKGKGRHHAGREAGGKQRAPLTLGARERKAWKGANREAEEKATVDPGRGGMRHPPPPEPDPILGTAGAGALLGARRGIIRAEAWSLPRRSSAAATLLPIVARAAAARWLAEEEEPGGGSSGFRVEA